MSVDHREIERTLALLAIPAFAAIVADQMLGIADTIVIGTFGAAALAAITGGTSVFITIVLGIHGLSRGVGILGAQAIGAGDLERFGRIVRAARLAPAAFAVVLAPVALILARPVLRALIGSLPSLDDGAAYLILRCFSLLPLALSGIAATAFGAAGDTRFAFKLLVCINLVHIPLLLVLGLGWITHRPLGLVGAGASSLCAELAGTVYSVWYARRRPGLRIFAGRGIDMRLAARMFRLGLPEAVYLFLVVAPDIATVAILAPLGAQTVAAFRVLAIVADVTWAVPGGLGEAAQIVIGQRFGANDAAGARLFERGALRYGLALSTLCGAAVAALAWPIAFGCTLDAGLASLAALPLAIQMATMPLKGYAMLGIARVRAAGDTRFSMLVGILASIIAVPGMWFGVHVLHAGLFAVPLAWITAWAFWCGATAVRLHRFDWTAVRLAA